MRIAVAVAAIALIAHAACSPKAADKKAEEAAPPSAPAAAQMTPGQWRTTVTIVAMAVPGVPPEAVASMKTRPFTSEECVTAQDLDAFLDKRTARNPAEPENCKIDNRSYDGGKINAQSTCTDASGQSHVVKMTGTYAAERVEMEVNVSGDGARGPQSQTMQLLSERIGECRA